MKFKKLKKGFTLVELVVVIAVIAILGAVSVGAYFGITEAAKKSSDEQTITQINKALETDEILNGKPKTMSDALKIVEESGFIVEKLTPTYNKYNYVWDSKINRMFILDENKEIVLPNDISISSKANIFVLLKDESELSNWDSYSVYLSSGFSSDGVLDVAAGIDVGNNEDLTINYSSKENQSLIFNANNTTFNINGELTTIDLYGISTDVKIEKIDNECLNLYGTITNKLLIFDGTAKIMENSIVNIVEANTANSTVSVNGGTVENQIIANDANVNIESGSTVPSVVATGTSTINSEEDVNVYADSTVTTSGSTNKVEKINVSTIEELENALNNTDAYICLTADLNNVPALENDAGHTTIIDLNGHEILARWKTENVRHEYALTNYGELTILDSSTTKSGAIKSRGIQNLGNGKLIVNGGTIESMDSNGGAAIWNEANLEVNGGKFTTVFIGTPSDSVGPGCLNNSGIAIIRGGEFISVNRRTYSIISTGDLTVKPSTKDSVVVSGAHGGIASDGGSLVIYGGTYSSTDYYGLYVSNDGVGVDPTKAFATIYGGTFSGKSYSVWVGSDINESVNSTIDIKGGYFMKDVNAQENSREGAIIVYSGTFEGFDWENSNAKQYLHSSSKYETINSKTIVSFN